MSCVLVALPIVNPPSVEAKLHPLVLKLLVNESDADADSMRSAPGPLKVLVLEVGALLANTNVPPDRVVAPV